MTGYVKLWRGWRDNPVLRDPERALAWLWLIENAAWKPGRVWIKGQSVDLERGELSFSVRFLAEQWGWSKSAVDRFLTVLRNEGMIQTRSKTGTPCDHKAGQGQSILTICNYVRYQSIEDADRDNSGTTTGTTAGQQRDKEEESKKERIEESDAARAHASEADAAAKPAGIDPREGWDDDRVSLANLANRFAVAGGVALDFRKLPDAIDQVKVWLALTTDTELIESAIRQVVATTKQKRISSLSYFTGAVGDAIARKEAPRNGRHRSEPETLASLALRLAAGADEPGQGGEERLDRLGGSSQPVLAAIAFGGAAG